MHNANSYKTPLTAYGPKPSGVAPLDTKSPIQGRGQDIPDTSGATMVARDGSEPRSHPNNAPPV
jgi:hypothetical protein